MGIAGVPGSGKSTLAAHLQARINALAGGAVAAAVPMDGYHLTRAQLDAMPDPEEAHMRRGAPWTFDPGSYLATLRSLRTPGAGEWDWRWCAAVGGADVGPQAITASAVAVSRLRGTLRSAHAQRHRLKTGTRCTPLCLATSMQSAGSQACPSFDHGVGDPRPGDIRVEPHHSIILTEGNYLLIGRQTLCSVSLHRPDVPGPACLPVPCTTTSV